MPEFKLEESKIAIMVLLRIIFFVTYVKTCIQALVGILPQSRTSEITGQKFVLQGCIMKLSRWLSCIHSSSVTQVSLVLTAKKDVTVIPHVPVTRL